MEQNTGNNRWTRNVGSGDVGHSGGKTEYRTGVRIDNWVENEATYALAGTRRSVVDDGAPFFCSSNQQISYTSEGKQGADLLKSVFIARDDGYAVPSRKADTLLRHGDFAAPRIQCLATTYNLVHGPRRKTAVKVDSERHTQEFLWKGSKDNDRHVPLSVVNLRMTARKQAMWKQEAIMSGFDTSSRTSQHASALAAASPQPQPEVTPRPGTSGSLVSAKKPFGMFVEDCDKAYHRTGLRAGDGW